MSKQRKRSTRSHKKKPIHKFDHLASDTVDSDFATDVLVSDSDGAGTIDDSLQGIGKDVSFSFGLGVVFVLLLAVLFYFENQSPFMAESAQRLLEYIMQ